jgi:hypothetical protein
VCQIFCLLDGVINPFSGLSLQSSYFLLTPLGSEMRGSALETHQL